MPDQPVAVAEVMDRIRRSAAMAESGTAQPAGSAGAEPRATVGKLRTEERRLREELEVLRAQTLEVRQGRRNFAAHLTEILTRNGVAEAEQWSGLGRQERVARQVQQAAEVAAVGTRRPDDADRPGLRRLIGRLVSRTVLRLAGAITAHQRVFNAATTAAIDSILTRLETQEELLLQVRLHVLETQRSLQQTLGPSGGEEAPATDELFVELARQFRGSRDEIRARLEAYVPDVRQVADEIGPGLFVDLGSGRGEWLEILGSLGVAALGVDRNTRMVASCRERGFEVAEEDVLDFLRRQDADSLRGVTAFHLIEHLPFETIIRLLDESLRVLAPGGLLIVETPNPENVIVSATEFYLDPSHLSPIHPRALELIVGHRGFVGVEVRRLREFRPHEHRLAGAALGGSLEPRMEAVVEVLRERLDASWDFGLIARKTR